MGISNSYASGQASVLDMSCYQKDTINGIKPGDAFARGADILNVGTKMSCINSREKNFLPQTLSLGGSYKIDIDSNHSLEIICVVSKLVVPTPPIYAADSFRNALIQAPGYLSHYGKDPDRCP